MNTEKQLQEYIVKQCKAHAMLVYKFAAPGRRGVPDLIIFASPGLTWLVEVKSPAGTGKLTELQARTILRIESKQIPVSVLATKAEVDAWLENLLAVIDECVSAQ